MRLSQVRPDTLIAATRLIGASCVEFLDLTVVTNCLLELRNHRFHGRSCQLELLLKLLIPGASLRRCPLAEHAELKLREHGYFWHGPVGEKMVEKAKLLFF